MTPTTSSVFALPERVAAKADPVLIAADEKHFAAVADALQAKVADLSAQLDALRRAPGGHGRAASDRDLETHRLTARLRVLRRFGLDVCLGRMVPADDSEPTYIGRVGLTDAAGRRLLTDWRAPAAEPFFAATHAHPLGLRSRRRYRWAGGRIVDFWDEVFRSDGVIGQAALDAHSAFVAGLDRSRSGTMPDVLGTIQADQDAAIRAHSRGALVVEGGPGTGKTVVALHRAAYLCYADPRLANRHADPTRQPGVLVVGPHRPYLGYVADVLPDLGEEGVQVCTLRDLVPEGAAAGVEADPEVLRLKASADLLRAIEPAVALYEEPPRQSLVVETDWGEAWLGPRDWAEAFEAADPGTPHNEARDEVWLALVGIVADQLADAAEPDEDGVVAEIPVDRLRRELARDEELTTTFSRAWTLVEAADLVGDLWSVPAYLRRCAPWLDPEQVRRLQRADPQAWTVSDLPLLDAARHRLGDPQASRLRRRREAAVAAQHEVITDVIGHLVASATDLGDEVYMLKGSDLQAALVHDEALPKADPDRLAGPFAHVIVDEAQELTDAEWQMLLRRCPSRSFTIVGDRAQARHGFAETWSERLRRVGFDQVRTAGLRVNYRTPEEVMAEAEPVIRSVLPDADVPVSIRRTGVPVRYGSRSDLRAVLDEWLAREDAGIACVLGAPDVPDTPQIRSLSLESCKGLEFDLVVLVGGEPHGDLTGQVDRYVAMTRSTRDLVVLD